MKTGHNHSRNRQKTRNVRHLQATELLPAVASQMSIDENRQYTRKANDFASGHKKSESGRNKFGRVHNKIKTGQKLFAEWAENPECASSPSR